MLKSKNDTIRELKKALEEANAKVVKPGDIVKFEGNYNLVTFKADNFIVHFSAREEDTVELCGTLIALEKVRSE